MLAAYITGMTTTAAAFVIWQALGHWKRQDRYFRIAALVNVAQDTCDLWAYGYDSDLSMTRQIKQLNDAINAVSGEEE